MEKYNNCSLLDLVWDDAFRQWVLSPTPETNTQWHQWLSENPEKWDIVQDASEVVKGVKVQEPVISDQEIRLLIQKTIQKIDQIEQSPQNTISLKPREQSTELEVKPLKKAYYIQPLFKIAAAVTLLIGLGWWAWGVQKSTQFKSIYEQQVSNEKLELIETINKTDASQVVHLSDGSKVTLKKGSRISYEPSFIGDYRTVYLSGEAFFEVAKNPNKPFVVYANELVTKVLGTSFTIKAYQEDTEVIVEVKTGRVSVSTQKSQDKEKIMENQELKGLVITPNQKIIFNREVEQLTKTLVAEPEIAAEQNEKQTFNFDFDDTPASEVFQVLKEAYHINILYDGALMKDCPVTAPLTDQSLFDKLKIICKAIGATYEVLDGQIIIQSKGCK